MITFSTDTPLKADHDMLRGEVFQAEGKNIRVRFIEQYTSGIDGSQRWGVDAYYLGKDGTRRAITYRTTKLRAAVVARFAK